MRFVCFNTKEPRVNLKLEVLDDLKEDCEIKTCEVGESMVFTTKDSTYTTSPVISVDENLTHILVETKNSFYYFEK